MHTFQHPSQERIEQMADLAFEEYSRFFTPDGCVIASRVLIDALTAVHIEAHPLSVVAGFGNAIEAAHVERHGCNMWSCGEDHRGPETGAAVVILGLPPYQRRPLADDPTEKDEAHVAVVVDKRFLVDITVSQASHPEVAIKIDGTLVMPVVPEFTEGRAELIAQSSAGLHVRYFAFPDDKWYATNSPDWTWNTHIRRELAAGIVMRWKGKRSQYSRETMLVRAITGRT